MHRHNVIFLEEPPANGLQEMLQGELSIDDYLLPTKVEYPDFIHRWCLLLRELYQDGKKIIQVGPFLEHLLAIHIFFSQGHRPKIFSRTRFTIGCIRQSEMRPRPF
jgi:hypothetical protein